MKFIFTLYYNVRCDALRWQSDERKTVRTVKKLSFEAERITSRKNGKIIHACSLSEKKNRDREGLFAFEGEKLFCEALAEGVEICEVYFTEKAMSQNREALEKAFSKGASLYLVTREVYDKLTYEKASQGIFAVAVKKELAELSDEIGEGFIILESLRDPSNVGAVIRTCAALGSNKILLTDDCADVYGYKALRAAMGTVFKTELYVTSDVSASIRLLQKSGKVYAAALREDAVSIADVIFEREDSIVIGNEGHGVSQAVLEACDGTLIIPMQCGTESLNASVAAAILIWEKAVKTGTAYKRSNG